VPTQIAYNGRHDPTGEWGHSISEGRQPIGWFKLLLLKERDIPSYVKASEYLTEARRLLQAAGKTPQQAVADFLRHLWAHALEEMERELGEYEMLLPFKVVITVPAIWKPYAIQEMEKAAEKAGILAEREGCEKTELIVVSEPEAAAMSTLWEFRHRHSTNVGISMA
jgi:molecular chaperone DnaK (HSP70)